MCQYCSTLFLWKRDGYLTVWLVSMQQVEHVKWHNNYSLKHVSEYHQYVNVL